MKLRKIETVTLQEATPWIEIEDECIFSETEPSWEGEESFEEWFFRTVDEDFVMENEAVLGEDLSKNLYDNLVYNEDREVVFDSRNKGEGELLFEVEE